MADPLRTRGPMTVDEFLAWAGTWAEGERWELDAGEPVRMSAERSRHALVKMDVARELDRAVAAAGLDCTVWPDGMTVPVDEITSYEPDAVVQCGPPPDLDALRVEAPVIVAEVLSPTTSGIDAGGKLAGYFGLASLRHYLMVDPAKKVLVVHSRRGDGRIDTTILREGEARLDPPGIALSVAALFARV